MNFVKLSALAIAAFAATGAQAATYTEGFDAPFASWETNWFGTQSNAANYYVSEYPGTSTSYQGADIVTGLWLSDGDSYRDGGDYGQININFANDFGALLTSFSMDVATALPGGAALVFFDIDGVELNSFLVPLAPSQVNFTPVGYTNVSVTSTNGIGGFRFTGFAQGNTIVDNLVAVTAPVPEPATWAMMMIGFGAMGATLRRRNKVSATVRFA